METYEHKYNELVEAVRAVVEGNPGLCDMNKRLGRVRDLLPVLKESEDERIRKKLYNTVLGTPAKDEWFKDINKYKMLSYLEKQKEQNTLSTEETELNSIAFLEQLGYTCVPPKAEQKPSTPEDIAAAYQMGLADGRREQKPTEWSEEDEIYLQDALWCIKQASKVARGENDMGACWSAERWLKSLRPQPRWKPSEEQIDALRVYLYHPQYIDNSEDIRIKLVESLYNDLKKLV